MTGPKILALDIETSPLTSYHWGTWDQNIALNQIQKDWVVLSWAAKWLGGSPMHYMDQRKGRNAKNEKRLLKGIWKLIDEADILLTQNGKQFDLKKLNARFVFHGFKPPRPYKHIDTLTIAKSKFGFTSNKLAYMADFLTGSKKSEHKKFPGFELWIECLKGNQAAWKEMELYNKKDVTVLEEVYDKLKAWDTSVNYNVYTDEDTCFCGSQKFMRRGYHYTQTGKFQIYRCNGCGKWSRGSENLLSKERRKGMRR